MTRIRRNRGGQAGNQNARKHGFYSAALTPAEHILFSNITTLEGVDPVVAFLRVKLQSSLQSDPGNRRVLADASRALAKRYSAQYGLDRSDRNYLKTIIECILESVLAHRPATPADSRM